MNKLTDSNIQRQNILNNRFALERIQEYIGFTGMLFENEYKFTKRMVAEFYEVDISTVARYLTKFEEELKYNGYILIRGKLLKELKLQFGHLIDKVTKTTILGILSIIDGKNILDSEYLLFYNRMIF